MPNFLTPPPGFDIHPAHRLWPVGSLKQLVPNGWPVFAQGVQRVADGLPIDARTPLIPPDLFPSLHEVVSLAHLLHESFFSRRAFGFSLRRRRFGPLLHALRGFTRRGVHEGQR